MDWHTKRCSQRHAVPRVTTAGPARNTAHTYAPDYVASFITAYACAIPRRHHRQDVSGTNAVVPFEADVVVINFALLVLDVCRREEYLEEGAPAAHTNSFHSTAAPSAAERTQNAGTIALATQLSMRGRYLCSCLECLLMAALLCSEHCAEPLEVDAQVFQVFKGSCISHASLHRSDQIRTHTHMHTPTQPTQHSKTTTLKTRRY